jgi:hypothetical protein
LVLLLLLLLLAQVDPRSHQERNQKRSHASDEPRVLLHHRIPKRRNTRFSGVLLGDPQRERQNRMKKSSRWIRWAIDQSDQEPHQGLHKPATALRSGLRQRSSTRYQ